MRNFAVPMKKKVEILAPAKNLYQGMAAINAGADAVYIGAPQFGARTNATNSVEDIVRRYKKSRGLGLLNCSNRQ
jgi:23S rRNA 5-hydroxycytidine C2501 synthase